MLAATILIFVTLWSGFTFVHSTNGGDWGNTFLRESPTLVLVILFFIGMTFTLLKKRWGMWLFGAASIAIFIFGGLPGTGATINQLGVVGFLGTAAAFLVYRQRNLLS